MSEPNAETLSALMDNEADQLELRRLLNHVNEKSDIRARWQRYHMARGALGKDLLHLSHLDVSARVREQVEQEPAQALERTATAIVNKKSGDPRFGLKPLAGFAVAASVTAAVFIGIQAFDDPSSSESSSSPGDRNAVAEARESAGSGAALRYSADMPAQPTVTADQAQLQQKLQTYMQVHAQQASMNTGQGMLPLARAVSYEVE